MKKSILYMFLFATLFLAGCEDNREADLPTDTINIRLNGVNEVLSYDLGEAVIQDLWAYRSGLNGASASVEYVINENLITEHNTSNIVQLKMLPSDCYTITGNTKFNISGDEQYAKFAFTYYPEKIVALSGYGLSEYALPFELKIDGLETGINGNGNKSIVRFYVNLPVLKIVEKTTQILKVNSTETVTLISESTSITPVGFKNKWEIGLSFINNTSLIADYNTKNGKDCIAFPEGSYTIEPTNPVLSADKQSTDIKYKFDASKLKPGYSYLFPMQLEKVLDPPRFEADPDNDFRYLTEIEVLDSIIPQSNWEIHDFRDSQPNDGGGPVAIIDDALSTYWHANYSSGSLLPSWITVKLKEDSQPSIMVTRVDLYARQNNAGGPKTVEVLTSMDGTNFTLAGTLSFKNTKNMQKVYIDPPVKARYVKMNITEKNNNSVAMAEMYVRGYEVR